MNHVAETVQKVPVRLKISVLAVEEETGEAVEPTTLGMSFSVNEQSYASPPR